MTRRRNQILLVIIMLAVSLTSSSVVTAFVIRRERDVHFETLGKIVEDILAEAPEDRQMVWDVLKSHKEKNEKQSDENILAYYGYTPSDFFQSTSVHRQYGYLPGIGCIAGISLFLFVFWYLHKGSTARIDALADYLSKVNHGNAEILLQNGEDDFARLQDEIYKTVTTLNQTRDTAVKAKERFAENLANIAHQLKTPITALSLSVQMIEDVYRQDAAVREVDIQRYVHIEKYLRQMKGQLTRLTYLEEMLLLLSRVDAGTLSLKREPVDVFTVLTLAADNLEEMCSQTDVSVDVAEAGEAVIMGDMEWTMEALMNLMKNCIEHTSKGGAVHCSYKQNPLYVEIRIWDEGEGFAREDLPHLFERFYTRAGSGIGIGLAFSKELIEMQNGVISAENIKGEGACFDIRFYSH